MKKIAIIGKGNVGIHLERALKGVNIEPTLIDSRSLDGLSGDFDLILICVSDTAISQIAHRIAEKIGQVSSVVAHTSGSVSIEAIKNHFKKCGVVYPLQTFSKTMEIKDYSEIPFFIEGNTEQTEKILKLIASLISDNVFVLDSKNRKKLHLASVFACNFVNALYCIGEDLLKECNIPFEILRPIIMTTAEKVISSTPKNCQTGPAKRRDEEILTQHLKMLADKKELREIYRLLSEYIIAKTKNE